MTKLHSMVEYTPGQIHRIFTGLILLMLLGTIDQAIVAPALVPIGVNFSSLDGVEWIVTAYLLTSTASIPIAGRLSDIYGRRNIVIAALSVFLIGTIVCASSTGLMFLIIGRSIQGLGGGALMTLPNTIVADILSPRERGRYQVYITGTYAVSSLAGPILGGYISGNFAWQWIFLIKIPFIAIALLLSWLTLEGLNVKREDIQIDYVGSALLMAATVSLLLALNLLGHLNQREPMQILVLFVIFSALVILIFRRQRSAARPIFPTSVVANPVIIVTSIAAVLITMVNTPMAVFIPLYLQWVKGVSVADAGYYLTAPLFGVVAGSYLSGQYMRYTGKYKLFPIISLTIAASSLAFCALWVFNFSLYLFVVITFFAGLGIGGSFVPMMVSSQNSVPSSDIGIATAIHTYSRAVGGALGVVFFTAVVLGTIGGSSGQIVKGPQIYDTSDDYFSNSTTYAFFLFFVISSIIIVLALGVLTKLPVLPFRKTSARIENSPTVK